ncbi:MAG: dihydroorotate dehydrogenase electron transfer subunit [Thermoplasmata archaeon]
MTPSSRTVVPIEEVTRETPSTVTLRFPWTPVARPGQFVMVWIPGDDELPMSLSYPNGPLGGVTVKAMGETSRAIQGLNRGDRIGIRGPYGTPFDLTPRRVLIVAGGSGTAVLAPAAEAARAAGHSVDVALGAVTAPELLFRKRFERMGARTEVATDDGSEGTRGYVTPVAERLLEANPYDVLWTCGPEVMMRRVADLAGRRSVPVVCAVERQMKCALGLCDACALGPFHVCVDGPVLPWERLRDLEEFGRSFRDPSGRRRPYRTGAP